jgi:hypothetical protein
MKFASSTLVEKYVPCWKPHHQTQSLHWATVGLLGLQAVAEAIGAALKRRGYLLLLPVLPASLREASPIFFQAGGWRFTRIIKAPVWVRLVVIQEEWLFGLLLLNFSE